MSNARPADPESLLEALHQAPSVCLILDYDGTLVPIEAHPSLAYPDAELLDLLRGLSRRRDRSVHLVSGRLRSELDNWFGPIRIGLHAEHGVWSRFDPGQPWQSRIAEVQEWPQELRAALRQACEMLPGSLLETKTASLAFHFRQVRRDRVSSTVPSLRSRLGSLAARHGLEILEGSEVIEVKARGISKALVVEAITGRLAPGWAVVAFGDDTTDEDMFGALLAAATTVRVGPGNTRAQYRVEGPAQVRAVLTGLL